MFLICGEALYDFFLVDEAGAGQLKIDARPGGSPYNVAIGMARLGAPSALLTGLSDDMLGARLSAVLAEERVNADYLVRTDRRTTLSLVGVDAEGGPAYTFYGSGSADCSLTEADLPAIDPEIRGLHFGSYSIAVKPVADAFATLAARKKKRFISLDPNVRPTIEPDMAIWRARIDALLETTNLVKVSDEDITALFPGMDPLEIVQDWARRHPAMVILTCGESEAVAVRGDDIIRWKPLSVTVIDTVGAGDTFMAALLTILSKQDDPTTYLATMKTKDIEEMLCFASTAAGITCSRRGANLPTHDEVTARLNETRQ